MLTDSRAFSGFSTNDIAATSAFYADTLGLDVSDDERIVTLKLAGGQRVIIYPKDDHQPRHIRASTSRSRTSTPRSPSSHPAA